MLNLQRKAEEEELATLQRHRMELDQKCRYKDVASWKDRFLKMKDMVLPMGDKLKAVEAIIEDTRK